MLAVEYLFIILLSTLIVPDIRLDHLKESFLFMTSYRADKRTNTKI